MINYYGYQSNENSENEGNSVTRKSKHNFRLDNPADADTPDRHTSPEYSNMIGYKMMKNLSYNKQAFLANNSQHLGDSPENEWNTSGEEHIYYDRGTSMDLDNSFCNYDRNKYYSKTKLLCVELTAITTFELLLMSLP